MTFLKDSLESEPIHKDEKMHLYTFTEAPNPKRLHYFLSIKNIEIETSQIDLLKKENLEESFLAINKLGTVPALVLEDQTVLTEVIGICSYLESLYPSKRLLGESKLEYAEVLSWDHFIFINLLLPIAEIFRNSHPAFKDRALPGPNKVAQLPELIDRAETRLALNWPMIDSQLESRDFLASETFSLADIDLLVCIEFMQWALKKPIPSKLSNIESWLARAKTIV